MDIVNTLKDFSSSLKRNESKENSEKFPEISFWDKVIRAVLFLVIFGAPLFFLPLTSSPLYLNKQVFVIILTLIIFIAWLFRFISKGQIFISVGLIFKGMLLLLIGLAISSIFSISFLDAIRIEAQPLSLILMSVLIFFAFFLASEINSGLNFKKPFFWAVLSVFLIAIFSIFQIFGIFILPFDFAKVTNFNLAGSHIAFGFLAASVLIAIAFYLIFASEIPKKTKIILNISFWVLLLYLILINYQIIWYLLALFSIFVIIVNFLIQKSGNDGLSYFRSLGLIILVCVVSIFFIITKNPLVFLRPQLPIEVLPSLSSTFNVLQETFREGVLKLIFGSGPATFPYDWDLYKTQEINNTIFFNTRFFGGFSMFLTYLVENGVLGGLFLLLFIISFIICGFKVLRKIKEGEVSFNDSVILLSSFIAGLFLMFVWFVYPPSFSVNLLFFVFLGILWGGATLYNKKCQKVLKFPEKINYAVIFTLILIILIVLGFSGLYLEGKRYVGAVYFDKGQKSLALQGDIDKAIFYTSKAQALDLANDLYFRSFSQILLLKLNQDITKGATSNVQAIVANAIDQAKQATNKNPVDYLNWMNLGNVYENLILIVNGAESFANSSYLEAQKRNPKNPEIQLAIARAKIINYDKIKDQSGLADLKNSLLKQATEDINKAISLKSNYSQAYILKSQIYDRKGDTEGALDEIKKAQILVPQDAVLYFQAGFYNYKLARYESAKQEFLAAISLDPNYSNARYFLGLIFDREGKKSLAIEQFELIEKLNPQNEEVKAILKNLRAGKPALSGISRESVEEPIKESVKKGSK